MSNAEDLEALIQLLPFYVNGTLALAARAKIEAALEIHDDLRVELAELRQLSGQVKRGGEAIMAGGDDLERRLERISERLDDFPPDAPPFLQAGAILPSLRPGVTLGYLNPARWHPAVSLALALALVAQTAFLVSQRSGQEYQTASGEDQFPVSAAPRLIVRLQPDAKWQEVEALFAGQSLVVIAGPDDGRLTVQLDDPHADASRALAALRASPTVAFADRLK